VGSHRIVTLPALLTARRALALSVVLYLASLNQVGICINGQCNAWPPVFMLLLGCKRSAGGV